MLKQGLTWSVILIFFINFILDEMIFSLLQVSRDREKWLKLLPSDSLPCVVYCTKLQCFQTSRVFEESSCQVVPSALQEF